MDAARILNSANDLASSAGTIIRWEEELAAANKLLAEAQGRIALATSQIALASSAIETKSTALQGVVTEETSLETK